MAGTKNRPALTITRKRIINKERNWSGGYRYVSSYIDTYSNCRIRGLAKYLCYAATT
jgi:hypothetical protein